MTKYIKDSGKVVEHLTAVLANSYALYLKTQNAHWNVVGPFFGPLHDLFGSQYEDLAEAIDEVAERIRALGAAAPGGLSSYADIAKIEDLPAAEIKGEEAIKVLLADHETLIEIIHDAQHAAEDACDEATADMMIERLEAHEKAAWMLRAHLS